MLQVGADSGKDTVISVSDAGLLVRGLEIATWNQAMHSPPSPLAYYVVQRIAAVQLCAAR